MTWSRLICQRAFWPASLATPWLAKWKYDWHLAWSHLFCLTSPGFSFAESAHAHNWDSVYTCKWGTSGWRLAAWAAPTKKPYKTTQAGRQNFLQNIRFPLIIYKIWLLHIKGTYTVHIIFENRKKANFLSKRVSYILKSILSVWRQ